MYQYQAVIIGFGKGGKTLAKVLAKAGWTVAIIEQSDQMYGGTCINIGCIPTKTLVHDAEKKEKTDLAFTHAMQRKDNVTSFLRDKNYHNLADLEQVTVILGQASFIDNHHLKVQTSDGEITIQGDKIFINTGAKAVIPKIEGLDRSQHVYDSTGLLTLTKRPKRLGIIGAGYIGVEFASMFVQFGCEVTVFEGADTFLAREDRDIADAIQQILTGAGVKFIFSAGIEQVKDSPNGTMIVRRTAEGETEDTFDAILVASGRAPNTDTLQLNNAGIEVSQRGAIKVDQYLRTSAKNIWALGDVNGGLQFTYISLDDFRIVKDQLLGTGQRSLENRKNVPYSVFMTPTLSRIGITEAQAKAEGRNVIIAKMPAGAIPRARVIDDIRGLLKAVVDADNGHILGVSLLCQDSHEVINIIKTVMDADLPYTVLRDQIFTHPTMSEALNDLFELIG